MINKNDFVEIEFTGKIADSGEVFDTNIKEDAKKANPDIKNIKPFVLSVGHLMLPSGFDEDLIGKEAGKNYRVELNPEKAFGIRNSQLVRMIPTKLFHEQKINPERGMQLALDGQLVKVLSSSGGRTLVDFNNPLAGKNVSYEYKINRVVTDEKEKIDSLQEFLFRRKFDFEKKDEKIIFKVEKQFEPFVKLFGPKFEEVIGMKVEVEVN
ncbi:MAG: peptidylprolyl isomerase [Nanoarchaeota archaeon]|nr:peptidylprolyl isomerase [Nanoarchaeota archaeon]